MKIIRRFLITLVALAMLLAGVPVFAQTSDPATNPDNRAIIQRYIEIVNSGELDALAEIVAPDFHQTSTGLFPNPLIGPALLQQEFGGLRAAFPDLGYSANQIISEDTLVSVLFSMTGTHEGPYLGAQPNGNRIVIPSSETFRIVDGKIVERWVVRDTLALVQQMTAPKPAAALLALVPAEEIAAFGPDQGMESVAIDRKGNIYVTTFAGEIRKIAPDRTQSVFAKLPNVSTIAVDARDNLYSTAGGNDPTAKGVWRFTPDGEQQQVGTLPAQSFPNGIALDRQGNMFIADSFLGLIWRIPRGGGEAKVWLQHELLSPRQYIGSFPGANGLKFYRGSLYVANSDKGIIVRIPVLRNSGPGNPRVHATGIPTDDFAFDVKGNLYSTTHPFNTVVRVRPDGSREVLATAEQGVYGPTAAVFGTLPGEQGTLFVVTDGGLFAGLLPGGAEHVPDTAHPSVITLDVGIRGLPLP